MVVEGSGDVARTVGGEGVWSGAEMLCAEGTIVSSGMGWETESGGYGKCAASLGDGGRERDARRASKR